MVPIGPAHPIWLFFFSLTVFKVLRTFLVRCLPLDPRLWSPKVLRVSGCSSPGWSQGAKSAAAWQAGGGGRRRSLSGQTLSSQLPSSPATSQAPGLPGFPAPAGARALSVRLAEAGGRQAAGGGVVESAGSPQPRRAGRPP